jgi:hypothetical protein
VNRKEITAPATCPAWPGLCTDGTSGHLIHLDRHKVTDKRGETLLDVAFLQFTDDVADGPAVICIGAEDFDPSEVRAKTAELRRLLDQADEMADKVLALRA